MEKLIAFIFYQKLTVARLFSVCLKVRFCFFEKSKIIYRKTMFRLVPQAFLRENDGIMLAQGLCDHTQWACSRAGNTGKPLQYPNIPCPTAHPVRGYTSLGRQAIFPKGMSLAQTSVSKPRVKCLVFNNLKFKHTLNLLLVVLFIQMGLAQPRKIKLPPALNEVSGLYYAGSDSLWWHNDSGDDPVLYLTNGEGRIQKRVALPQLRNVDWEDLTADESGRLYIGDFGNNSSRRQDLHIYTYDPSTENLDSISFQYPDQTVFSSLRGSFDVEGFFWHNDSLHLFSKNKLPKSSFVTKHYVLSDQAGEQVAELRDSLYLRKRVVTGAAFERSTGTVALVAYYYRKLLGILPLSRASVFLFRDYPEGHFLRGNYKRKRISCLVATQYESVDFIGSRFLYVASEKTLFVKPRAKRVKLR